MPYDGSARLIWSLATSGESTTITTSGNSGAWAFADNGARYTPVDLRWADDVWLSVVAGTVTGTLPSLTVSLGGFDDQGNLFPSLLALTALTAAGQGAGFAGRHGGSSTEYVVLPQWGQVAWAVSGTTPSFQGCSIALYAR